ncbi:MAG: hypothetical protein IKG14_00085 [Clostridia bacterium]|nr:hypothetical protein [Clostridia bacterium]
MKKLFFLIQTFMFFFVIFIVKNIQFINIDWENSDLLSKVLKITDIVFAICVLISGMVIIYFRKSIIGAKKLPSKVISIKQEKEVSLVFFATYILPLVSIDINCFNDFLAFFIILILMFVLCLKTELWFTNPILSILGYKIYTIKCEKEINEETIISQDNIKIEDFIEKKTITDEVVYARKR